MKIVAANLVRVRTFPCSQAVHPHPDACEGTSSGERRVAKGTKRNDPAKHQPTAENQQPAMGGRIPFL